MLKRILHSSRHIFLYGGMMAVLVFVLKWLQWKYIVTDYSLDIYIGLIALFFTTLGVWAASQLAKPVTKTVVIEKSIYVTGKEEVENIEAELKKLNLTARECEVLHLITQGHTNAEIADKLCLSVSTIKTHVSNLFVKMDVKNRTQAMQKANRLKIRPAETHTFV